MTDRAVRFADFRVDPASRELWRAGRLVPLPPHVFDCLAYLIERRDRAVGRDELVAAVWGKTEVSDTLLGQTILRIRRELGDDAKEQRILRTIPRFGYRWIAPLDGEGGAANAPAATRDPEPIPTVAPAAAPVDAARSARFSRMAVALAVVAVLAATALALYRRPPPPGQGGGLVSAVLPASVEPGADWSWMRLGVMDVVASQLRSAGLASVPSENVIALLNTPEANRTGSLRDAMSAGLLITPHVHRVGSDWQVDLDADGTDGQRFAVDAHAHDATQAARAAADKLLIALGRRPAAKSESSPYAALVERVDAAILADDPDRARALIEGASAEQRQSPEVRLLLAKIDFRLGRFDAARSRLEGLLDEAPAQTAPVLRASILNGLGAVAIRTDAPEAAERAFGEAITLLSGRHTDSAQLGQAYLGRAAAASDLRRFEAAAADFARARVALREANDALALIRVAADEGFLDLQRSRPAAALPQFVAAAAGFRQWGALNEAIYAYIGQINSYLVLLDGRSAMQAADAAAELAQRIDNPLTLASLTIARARALASVGRLREARDALDHLRSSSSDAATVAAAGAVLAQIELENGSAAVAADLAERALLTLSAPTYAGLRADAWLTQVRAQIRIADAARAGESIAALEAWAAQSDYGRARAFAALARAEFAMHKGDSQGWRTAFESARKQAESDGVPVEIAAVARSYALALMAEGDLDAAEVEVGRVSRWSEQDFSCAVLEARLYAARGRNEARQAAVARARSLAGERSIPTEALATAISTRAASAQ